MLFQKLMDLLRNRRRLLLLNRTQSLSEGVDTPVDVVEDSVADIQMQIRPKVIYQTKYLSRNRMSWVNTPLYHRLKADRLPIETLKALMNGGLHLLVSSLLLKTIWTSKLFRSVFFKVLIQTSIAPRGVGDQEPGFISKGEVPLLSKVFTEMLSLRIGGFIIAKLHMMIFILTKIKITTIGVGTMNLRVQISNI